MKIISIEPAPSPEEAVAIAAALRRIESQRHRDNLVARFSKRARESALKELPPTLTWRETARLEAVDAGV